MNEHQALAIRALSNMMGDDSARARAAFRNCTPEQMQQEYGESGKTRARILADYEAHDDKVEKAILWVKAQRG
jgi:hypothetical protein